MIGRWIIYVWMWVLGYCLLACHQEDMTFTKAENLTLQLYLHSTLDSNRAVSAGDDWLNENKLNRVDCFFYPASSGATDNAVYTLLDYSLNQTTTGTISITLEEEEMEAIFPNGASTSIVYMIVNRPEGLELPGNTDLATLKAWEIETVFSGSGNLRRQNEFVMSGQSNVVKLSTDTYGKKKVAGHVDLYRAASKVDLVVTGVRNEITEGGVTWKSDPTKMYLRLHNGVSRTTVGTDQAYDIQPTDYFTTEYEHLVEAGDIYASVSPYYSYSSDWATDAEHEVYFTLVLPWAKVETGVDGTEQVGTYRTCYYQVPVNFNEKKLQRNTHYRLKLEVGILGSFDDPDAPEQPEIPTEVVLEPSYFIVPWSDRIDINAQLDRPTYLVVDKNYAEMNNISTINIGYASSHSIISVNVDKVEYYNYQNAATRKVTITSNRKNAVNDSNNSSATAPNDGITYDTFVTSFNENNHTLTLINKTNAGAFYTTQDIYLTITNQAGLSEQIKVRWYPPIYFMADLSNGIVFSNGYSYANPNDSYVSDYQYYYIKNDEGVRFGSISNPDYVRKETSNNNQNQYNIYITSLPSGSNLQIGDPRESQGGGLDGLEELNNYRKTRTDAGNIVAPIFKIASSFGKTSAVSFELAQERCASYQENGYPAGRWRIPTEGEFKFIVERSNNKDIPSLFVDQYWAGSGKYYNNGSFYNRNNNSSYAVRCVYDVWYWGDKKVSEENSSYSDTAPYWGDDGLKTHEKAQP